jgi:hypothetical protein
MKRLILHFQRFWPVQALTLALAVGVASCGKDIRVYEVAKDAPAADPHAALPSSTTPKEMPLRLTWTAPSDWSEAPRGEMRLASFKLKGSGSQQADISVIALSGDAGGDLNNVNRWRGQVGAAPVKSEELSKLSAKVEIGGAEADLFDLSGQGPSGDATRVVASILHREGEAWFFKMAGDDELVAKQKDAFIAFLRSIKFVANEEHALPAGHPPISQTSPLPQGHPPVTSGEPNNVAKSPSVLSKSKWDAPTTWKEEPPTQMLLAKYSTGDTSARAEITVSSFPGDVGGLLPNINRWRGQIGLTPITANDLSSAVAELKVSSATGSLVELENTNEKSLGLIGVSLPHNGQTWFFKMAGDAKTVAREKDAFLKFVKNVKLPDAS